MTYLRLYLPGLIPEADTILYLDSDLIVNTDVSSFFNEELGDLPLGAVHGANVFWDLDGDFLKSVVLADEDRVFNAGVLLLNAKLWRETGLMEQSLEFGRIHASFLRSADQTILNALFSRKFHALPKRYNVPFLETDKPLALADGIYHFVGSPKPWDPLGRFFQNNWRLWESAVGNTRFQWSDFLSQHLMTYALRAWTLRRSYFRAVRNKWRSKGGS
jgi:lipopolysaccharide biosynthesis glycosyltransferase